MGGHFDIDSLTTKLNALKQQTLAEDFYNDIKNSTAINTQISNLEKQINQYNTLATAIETNIDLFEIAQEEDLLKIKQELENLELSIYLSGEFDNLNCFLEIHAGAGGTESCDWVDMLFRMYMKFCEKEAFKYEIVSTQDGDEAGYKSVMLKIKGTNAFGYLKNESGVHRLVRISPFDSNSRRHTSFAAVNVTPEFNKINAIEIQEKDLKIDVFHSSGAGGQSVNTSNSAVRITHIPSKIVVSVQNERSQLKNKEIAIEILKSKLYAIEISKQKEKIQDFKIGDSINFGSQIRSYILEPYKLVKDHRTNYENTSLEKVLNGDIKDLLEYNLKYLKN